MAAEMADQATLAGARRFERVWARRASPAAPNWTLTLPLLALAALTFYAAGPFARADIEATVRAQTQALLAERGYGWVQVAVDGQNVMLRGTQPKPGDGDAALAVARDATCATWAGPLTCAVIVVGAFVDPPALPPAAATPPTPSPAEAAATCDFEGFDDFIYFFIAIRPGEYDISTYDIHQVVERKSVVLKIVHIAPEV